MKKAILIVLILASACGENHEFRSGSPPTPTPTQLSNQYGWTEQNLAFYVDGCVKAASAGDQALTAQTPIYQAFCKCMYDAVAKKWSHSSYSVYPNYYMSEMVRNGTYDACYLIATAGL